MTLAAGGVTGCCADSIRIVAYRPIEQRCNCEHCSASASVVKHDIS